MNDATDKKQNDAGEGRCGCNCDYSLAFLLLRGWLAVRAIVTGIEKFGAYKTIQRPLLDSNGQPDASGAMLDVKVKFYALANYAGIPPSLKGKFANEALLPGFALSLFVQGLIYIALTVGLILIKQDDGISWLGIHMALVALALMLAKHNKFSLLKKW